MERLWCDPAAGCDLRGRMRAKAARRHAGLVLGLGVVVALGCGSQPLPRVAAEGSTITIFLPQDFPTGFGRSLAQNPVDPLQTTPPQVGTTGLPEDLQRGELLFELVDGQGNPPHGAGKVYLPLRYITRLFADPSTPKSLAPGADQNLIADGVVLAVLDIPQNAVPVEGDYFIKVERYRRIPDNANSFEKVTATAGGQPWEGWGQDMVNPSSPGPIPIHILKPGLGDERTPKSGWDLFQGSLAHSNVADDMDSLVPFPQFVVQLARKPNTGSLLPPAAWEVEITYPREIMRIKGVTTRNTTNGSAVVTWTADETASVSCGAPDDTLKIQVLDPRETTNSVRVAFQLQNFDTPSECGARVTAADLQPSGFRGFDLNGVEQPHWTLNINGNLSVFD